MSIQSEITRISNKVDQSYDVIHSMIGSTGLTENIDNLPSAIQMIPHTDSNNQLLYGDKVYVKDTRYIATGGVQVLSGLNIYTDVTPTYQEEIGLGGVWVHFDDLKVEGYFYDLENKQILDTNLGLQQYELTVNAYILQGGGWNKLNVMVGNPFVISARKTDIYFNQQENATYHLVSGVPARLKFTLSLKGHLPFGVDYWYPSNTVQCFVKVDTSNVNATSHFTT